MVKGYGEHQLVPTSPSSSVTLQSPTSATLDSPASVASSASFLSDARSRNRTSSFPLKLEDVVEVEELGESDGKPTRRLATCGKVLATCVCGAFILALWGLGIAALIVSSWWKSEWDGGMFPGLHAPVQVHEHVVPVRMPWMRLIGSVTRVFPQITHEPSGMVHILAESDHDMYFAQVSTRRLALSPENCAIFYSGATRFHRRFVPPTFLPAGRRPRSAAVVAGMAVTYGVIVRGGWLVLTMKRDSVQLDFHRRAGAGLLSEVSFVWHVRVHYKHKFIVSMYLRGTHSGVRPGCAGH